MPHRGGLAGATGARTGDRAESGKASRLTAVGLRAGLVGVVALLAVVLSLLGSGSAGAVPAGAVRNGQTPSGVSIPSWAIPASGRPTRTAPANAA